MRKIVCLICMLICLCFGAKKSSTITVESCKENVGCFTTTVENVKTYKNIVSPDGTTYIRFIKNDGTVFDLPTKGKEVKVHK